jgi:hypothetical protein
MNDVDTAGASVVATAVLLSLPYCTPLPSHSPPL